MTPEVVRLGDGGLEVEVLPSMGARLHRLRAFGHDLLRTPADPETHRADPFAWGGYVMAPWCNRIEAGAVDVGPRVVELGSNFRDGTAIHGQVHSRAWEQVGEGAFRVCAGGDGWPWVYEVTLRIELSGGLVRIDQGLVNRSDDPMPAGLGLHPWFLRPLRVAIHGAAVHASNTASSARAEPVSGRLDLRRIGEMAADLDATWTSLADPAVALEWPVAGVRAKLRASAGVGFIVAANPSDLDAVAVEPQSHAPQGLRRLLNGEPGGLSWLEPGATLSHRIDLAFEPIGKGERG